MPTLQVRELPEHLYQKLQEQAKRKHRSLEQQAIVTLARELHIPLNASENASEQRQEGLAFFEKNADKMSKYKLSNPVKFIREDRER